MTIRVLKLASPLIILAAILILFFSRNYSTTVQLTRKVDELQGERTALLEYVKRLSSVRRVAQVDVLGQTSDERSGMRTTLRWQEVDMNGVLGSPLIIEAVGDLIYFEAMVIKFDHRFVGLGDNERGSSLAVFRRIFGDRQAPSSVPTFERHPPPSSDLVASTSDEHLWERFWSLVDDPVLAQQYGIRVAQCEAVAVPLHTEEVWEVVLEAAGGVNLKKIGTGASPRLSESSSPWRETSAYSP